MFLFGDDIFLVRNDMFLFGGDISPHRGWTGTPHDADSESTLDG